MPHHQVIHLPARHCGKTARMQRRTLHDIITPLPDFALPLIDRKNPASFTRSGRRGTIYPQFRNLDDQRHHPHGFYIEWPHLSEDFYEIHAPALANLALAPLPAGHTFTPEQVAVLLESIKGVPVLLTLHSARPRPASS